MQFWLLAAALHAAGSVAAPEAQAPRPASAPGLRGRGTHMTYGPSSAYGFNARLLHAPDLRGWNRYTVNLLGALIPLEIEPVLYTDRPLHPSHLDRLPEGSVAVRVAPAMPYPVWEQRWLPRQCGRDRVDLLHSPFNFGLPWSSPCPRVLTLHDAIGLGR